MTKGGCLLYIDGKVICFVPSLDEAQKVAATHLERQPALRVECFAIGEPMRSWQYHYERKSWIEQPSFK